MSGSYKPFSDVKEKILERVREAFEGEECTLEETDPKFGDLSLKVFELAKRLGMKLEEVVGKVASVVSDLEEIATVETVGGHVNIRLKRDDYAYSVCSFVFERDDFGVIDEIRKICERVVVEHTSANPNKPMHIGHFRSGVIGDVFANLLDFFGCQVSRRYYIDDLGVQMAPLAIGYSLLKEHGISFGGAKPDVWLGKVYAVMNNFLDIQRLKQDVSELLDRDKRKKILGEIFYIDQEEYSAILKAINEKISVCEEEEDRRAFIKLLDNAKKVYETFNELNERMPVLVFTLRSLVKERVKDLVSECSSMILAYEEGKDEKVKAMFREVTSLSVEGHKKTLSMCDIEMEDFDWESDVRWSDVFKEVFERFKELDLLVKKDGALVFKADELGEKTGAKKVFGISEELGDTVLVKSDGTTLYETRDIPYSIIKARKTNACKVFNVIGKAQKLPQSRIKVALYVLGYEDEAKNQEHLDFEFVHVKGMKMRGRLASYVTPDELFDMLMKNILDKMKERPYSDEEKREIAEKIAAASLKYAILKVSPTKSVIFEPEKAIDIKVNSAPFLIYAFVRSLGIMRTAEEKGVIGSVSDIIDYDLKDEEWQLIKLLSTFPETLEKVYDERRPDVLCTYAFDTATLFNRFYDTCPVVGEKDPKIRSARMIFVEATNKIMGRILSLLGIKTPEKM